MRTSKTEMAGLFIAGAAIGAFVTLLFAPTSGAQTRRDIRKLSKKTLSQLDDLQQEVREQVSDGYEQVKEVVDNVKDYVKDGKSGLQKLIKNV